MKITISCFVALIFWSNLGWTQWNQDGDPVCVGVEKFDDQDRFLEMPLQKITPNELLFYYEDDKVALEASVFRKVSGDETAKDSVRSLISVAQVSEKGMLEFLGRGWTSSGSWNGDGKYHNSFVVSLNLVYSIRCFANPGTHQWRKSRKKNVHGHRIKDLWEGL